MNQKLVNFLQNVLNDEDLSHLSVKDLKNVVLNLQSADEDEEEEEEIDESRFVI